MPFRIFLGEPGVDPQLYNCTGTKTQVEPHAVLGALYFVLGFFAQILFFFVLKTFFRRQGFWDNACYRIMFFLGIPDMLSLIGCAELAGIWSILGLHPCYDMQMSVLLGCLVFGTWHMSCFYVLILAFNRSCELVAPTLRFATKFSMELRSTLCSVSLSFTLFTSSSHSSLNHYYNVQEIYNVQESTFLLNPMTESTKSFDPELYSVYGFIFNNFFVMFFIGINYFTVCTFLLYHSCSTSVQKVSKVYRQVTIQCMVVCTCHFIGCFLYIYMQYVELPNIFHVIAQLAWIGNHGLPPFVYIIFNNTIRSSFGICNYKIVKVSSQASTVTKSLRDSRRRSTLVY